MRDGVLFAALLLLPLLAGAATVDEKVRTYKTNNGNGAFQATWADYALLSDAERDTFEGDPNFDFEVGVAAIETGNYGEAIFALQRVMFVSPDNLRVRLELARAYYFAGDLSSARREFERVRGLTENPNVRANIALFLQRIESAMKSRARTVDVVLDLGAGHDTNINSAVDDSTIGTPIGIVTLDATSQATDDEFARGRLGVRWVEPLTQYSSFDVGAFAEIKDNFSSNDFDLGILNLQGGYSRQAGRGRARVGVRLQQVMLDYDRFQNNYGLLASYDLPVGQRTLASISTAVTTIRYEGDALRDTDQYLLSGALARQIGQFTHSVSLYGADEPARSSAGDFNGRWFVGGMYSVQYELEHLTPFLRLLYQASEYDAEQPVFGEAREDDYLSARAGVRWRPAFGVRADERKLTITAEVGYTEIDSNLPIFSYDRWVIESGLSYSF